MKKIWILGILLSLFTSVFGQAQPKFNNNAQLTELSKQIFYSESSPERINANIQFIKALVNELKTPYSFQNHLDSLKTISILNAPDQSFRIFSWNVPYEDGSYRFYGAIQWNTPDGKLELIPLTDYSPKIKNTDTITHHTKWFGAQYYKIIPYKNAQQQYYLLLGWNGHNIESNKKVIEVLSFKGHQAIFGAPILPGEDQKMHQRLVFEYTKQASMYLNFDPKTQRIIFDHLAPPNEKLKELKSQYGPDLTFDALLLNQGKITYQSDIEVTNTPSNRDEEYIFPENANKAYGKKK